jgi:hypothetical protein
MIKKKNAPERESGESRKFKKRGGKIFCCVCWLVG